MLFTLMKTQDWVETSLLFDNDICPMISASGVSLSITTQMLTWVIEDPYNVVCCIDLCVSAFANVFTIQALDKFNESSMIKVIDN